MSSFSAMHWAIAAVIGSVLLYGLYHAAKAAIRFTAWIREK